MKLNYKQYGASGDHVIIVHGLFGMLDNWHTIAKKLSNHFLVTTVDVRNHGSSEHDFSMTYDDVCRDLDELLQDLHISKAHFVGHSMGGKAVMKLADLHPELIDKLCVVDIAPKRYAPGHEDIFNAMFALEVHKLVSRQDAENQLAASIPDASTRLFVLKNLERSTDGGYKWKLGLKEIYANYDQIIDSVEMMWPFSNDTLFIKGQDSSYITTHDETDVLSKFPNAKFVTIADAGHWVHAQNPVDFLESLESFLL